MKIIQYLPYSYHIHTGGLEKIAQTLSDGLNNENGINCLNIASDITRGNTTTQDGTFPDTLFMSSIDLIYNFPIPKFWTKESWRQIQKIKKEHPNTIITHTRFFVQSLIGGLIAKWIGCKRIHVEHGSGFVTGYPSYIKLAAWVFDWTIGLRIFRQCDQIVTISQMHKVFISKFTNKEPIVIYNPIDFQPQEKIPRATPTPSIKGDKKIIHIGFIGRLVHLKGVDILIKALADLAERERTCTIVGDGNERQNLENLTKELGLSDRITFVGADDRSHWLHKFDIFVNPSHQEGLPTTVVEALIAKCIVVATDIGGTREISDKDDLILVESGNTIKLREGIEKAFENLNKSGASYETVVERFGMEKALGRYRERLYPINKL